MQNPTPRTDKKLVLRKTELKTPPLSTAARVEFGQLLRRLLAGEMLQLPQSRPMPSIGARVYELRVGDQNQTWRLVYRIDPDAIVVVELFSKKTPQTPLPTIELCQKRFKAYDADKQAETAPEGKITK